MRSLVGSTPALFRQASAAMVERFHGKIPDDLLYDPEHDMWVRHEAGRVTVGATSYGIHRAGSIIAFTAKPPGANIERGRSLGTIECAKTVLAVHAPVSFILAQGNEDLEAHPEHLNHDPYAAWMARGPATGWDADCAQLVDAAAYRGRIRQAEPAADVT